MRNRSAPSLFFICVTFIILIACGTVTPVPPPASDMLSIDTVIALTAEAGATQTAFSLSHPGTPTELFTATPTPGIGTTMVSDKDGATLVYVPAGEFLMGSTDDDVLANANEKPQISVSLEAFWMDETEVTN